MKKATRNGKAVLVARSIRNVSVYEATGKTISSTFNYEDWSDIIVGFRRRIKELKSKKNAGKRWANVTQQSIAEALSGLSQDRLIRVAFLALRALVPSAKTFYLNYLMICEEDYRPETARFKDFNALLEGADQKLLRRWYDEIETFIVPLLKETFSNLHYLRPCADLLGWRAVPEPLIPFILELQEEARRLPIYWTDFKGVIKDGEIYHEPPPAHLPPIAREAYWRGGHHVSPKEIFRSQICDQGGSFGPICLAIIEDLLQSFIPILPLEGRSQGFDDQDDTDDNSKDSPGH